MCTERVQWTRMVNDEKNFFEFSWVKVPDKNFTCFTANFVE